MTERDTVLETAPAIRPFSVDVPEADLDDLRRRIAATQWPDLETVPDRSQGPQLAEMQELVRYWGTDYDWRKAEAQLNAFPQFMTTIDGVDIHFIHVRSRAEFDALRGFLQNGGWAYLTMMSSRPQAVGYGLTDSPAGQAGFMLVHGGFAQRTYGKNPNRSPTKDEVLDDLSLYWLTNTAVSAARLYWENRNENLISAAAQKTDEITIPVAITVFPNEDLFRAPETWARRAFPSLIYFHQAEAGGHFAAWEEPQLFSDEVRAAFGSLR
jgi:pimeloyl-ACP methyl ester carboxylesterase